MGIALGAATANAHGYKFGAISIGHLWAPPPKPDAAGVSVYGPFLNGGGAPVRLVGVSSPIAAQGRFRIMVDGAAHWVRTIELKPGKPLALAAWRQHIWLSGLKKPIAAGDAFDMTLDFGDAGRTTVKVIVESTPGD